MNNKKIYSYTLAVIISAYIVHCLILVLKYPVICRDESFIANAIYNLIYAGKFVNSTYEDFMPGAKNNAFMYFPGYYIFLFIIFKAFGFGILQARLFSTLMGAVDLLLIYNFILYVFPNNRIAALTSAVFVSIDFRFLTMSKIARVETLCLGFILFGCFYYIKNSLPEKVKYKRHYLFTGLIFAIAFMVHPVGGLVLFLIIIYEIMNRKAASKYKMINAGILLLPTIISIFIWVFLSILHDRDFFFWLMKTHTVTAAAYIPKLYFFMHYLFVEKKLFIIHIIYSAGIIYGSFLLFKSKSENKRFFGMVLLLFFIIAIAWKAAHYHIYFTIAGSLSLIVCYIYSSSKAHLYKKILFIVILLALANNMLADGYVIYKYKDANYGKFCEKIADTLPVSSRILIISNLDPYFGLLKTNKNFVINHSDPFFKTSFTQYIDSLYKYDYILLGFNRHGAYLNWSQEMLKNLQEHAGYVNSVNLGGRSGDGVHIFKVKNKNE